MLCVFSVYKIFINPDKTFLRKYYMCKLCDSTVIYQYIYIYIYIYIYMCVCVCVCIFFVAVIFDSHMYCINVIYNIFLYFNNKLSSIIM